MAPTRLRSERITKFPDSSLLNFKKQYSEIVACVACDGSKLHEVIDLGQQPLANDYLQSREIKHTFYPLRLMRCDFCFHSQLSIAVSPDELFRFYPYVSGTTKTLLSYFKQFVEKSINMNFSGRKILEIASNDGTLLKLFKEKGWKTLGVDPAINLLELSMKNGIRTIPEYFDMQLAETLASDFDLIVAMNVFAHTQNPLEMLLSMKLCLSEEGLIAIQTSQADMFITNQFDTIYHEHISFFNVQSMKNLVKRCGLHLVGVEIVPIHGNSYIWWISKKAKHLDAFNPEVRSAFELDSGLHIDTTYYDFKLKSQARAVATRTLVEEYRNDGYKIIAYGAAAKGNTFLNFSGITPDILIDDNPLKIGTISPLSSLEVKSSEVLSEFAQKCLFIIPAWNFKLEIREKLLGLRVFSSEDRTLVYFPELEVEKLR